MFHMVWLNLSRDWLGCVLFVLLPKTKQSSLLYILSFYRLKNGSKAGLTNLSNEFYTLIPHDFGRTRPPVIEDLSVVQEKFDMLITLGDIEIAQEMEKGQKASEALHPCDVKYGLLKCNLSPLDPCSHEFKVTSLCVKLVTKSTLRRKTIQDLLRG